MNADKGKRFLNEFIGAIPKTSGDTKSQEDPKFQEKSTPQTYYLKLPEDPKGASRSRKDTKAPDSFSDQAPVSRPRSRKNAPESGTMKNAPEPGTRENIPRALDELKKDPSINPELASMAGLAPLETRKNIKNVHNKPPIENPFNDDDDNVVQAPVPKKAHRVHSLLSDDTDPGSEYSTDCVSYSHPGSDEEHDEIASTLPEETNLKQINEEVKRLKSKIDSMQSQLWEREHNDDKFIDHLSIVRRKYKKNKIQSNNMV